MLSFPVRFSSCRHWVKSTNCPHFRRRVTVTDIRSCATPAHGRLSRAGIICSSNTFIVSLHAVVSLISLDVAHLAAADILRLRLCSTSLTLADFPFRRLLPLCRASAATVLSGHVTPCKVRLSFLIVLIQSLISVFMAPATTFMDLTRRRAFCPLPLSADFAHLVFSQGRSCVLRSTRDPWVHGVREVSFHNALRLCTRQGDAVHFISPSNAEIWGILGKFLPQFCLCSTRR
ncbi:hypothetical protein EDB89DRAFT_1471692 [Lactarius sanguifluus]|nr:hypothetical protein EDB89DRAFT_1471692 [Lactarius sanguifluus]